MLDFKIMYHIEIQGHRLFNHQMDLDGAKLLKIRGPLNIYLWIKADF